MKHDVLSKTKAKLIDLMKCEQEISVDQGAEALGLATTTIRQHLGKLEEQGFVKTRNKRYGRGRPLKMYSLTDKSDVWYESTEAEILGGLLEFLEEQGEHELVERYFKRVTAAYLREFEAFARGRSGDRISLICDYMESRGFVPNCSRGDDGEEPRLSFCHCPYRVAAETSQLPCMMEERFLEVALDKKLIREKHIASGDSVCQYRLAEFNT